MTFRVVDDKFFRFPGFRGRDGDHHNLPLTEDELRKIGEEARETDSSRGIVVIGVRDLRGVARTKPGDNG